MKLLKPSGGENLQSGFTLIEMLIVIGIFLIIFSVGFPIGLDFYLDYQFESEFNLLNSSLQYARNLAMVNHNESDHGLYLDNQNFVIFQGSSFASRVSSQDKTYPRTSVVAITGPSELIFSALSGETASSTYTLNDGRKTRNLYVNSEGLIYEPSY